MEDSKSKEASPYGPGIKPAMYILFDEAKGNFFVIGAPGSLDDPVRAYGALKIAERNLDEFYSKKQSLRESLMAGVRNFQGKMNFRSFIRKN